MNLTFTSPENGVTYEINPGADIITGPETFIEWDTLPDDIKEETWALLENLDKHLRSLDRRLRQM